MTEVAVRPMSDLAMTADQHTWTEKQRAALTQLGVKGANNADLAVFFHVAARTGLDPFARQVYLIGRQTKDGMRQTIQTGIDGYRLIARRAADQAGETLGYEDTLWCGPDGRWVDVWLSEDHPAAAKVVVLRDGHPFSAVALWGEYVQTDRQGNPNSMWARMGANQLAKCAEAAALRKAFPQDLSGLYTEDEMGQADRNGGAHVVTTAAPRVTAAEVTGRHVGRGQQKMPRVIEPDPPADDDPAEPAPVLEGQETLPLDEPPADWQGEPVEPGK
jgi:phage recombination protein Bet